MRAALHGIRPPEGGLSIKQRDMTIALLGFGHSLVRAFTADMVFRWFLSRGFDASRLQVCPLPKRKGNQASGGLWVMTSP